MILRRLPALCVTLALVWSVGLAAQNDKKRDEAQKKEIQSIIKVVDDGPGIADVEQAMQPGFSTATAAVRELGFGAGMGLPNIKRCADKLVINSAPSSGTKLELTFLLQPQDSLREARRAPKEE